MPVYMLFARRNIHAICEKKTRESEATALFGLVGKWIIDNHSSSIFFSFLYYTYFRSLSTRRHKLSFSCLKASYKFVVYSFTIKSRIGQHAHEST